ncbi:hypothetical protein [Bradyrhizobium ottawaense]|uniref:Uncharacterized protein n=1 Tax=Bradyrhizobium ottawaense TaxID=931866 RepID=A0ABV4FL61_9BRAD
MANLAGLLDPPTHQRFIRLAHLHGRSLKQREIDRFAELGVPALHLGSPWPILVDKVVFEGVFFSFADDLGVLGELAFTIVVFSNAGMIDVAAWQPETERLAVWRGDGFALGERQIHLPNPLAGGLHVFRSPIDWLRASRRGIVIVQPQFARAVLADVPVLVAEDEQHRKELQELFLFSGPQIILPEVASLEDAQ